MTSFDRAAQSYFDPPDPPDHTFGFTIELNLHAPDETTADVILREAMTAALNAGVTDWYVDNGWCIDHPECNS